MDSPLVSIIVTVYNQGQFLEETLESVSNQTFSNWECIIVNDGSIDDSEYIAKEFVSKDHRFHYLYQINRGVVSARNNAISHSNGKYILPLDGDDLLSPEYLLLAVDIMENDDSIKLVYCDVEYIGSKSGLMILPELTINNIIHTGCCVNTSMFRRESFDEVGGYKKEMNDGYEDWEFFMSIMELKGDVYKINKVLFYYRSLPLSRNGCIDFEKSKELKRTIFCLHPNLYYDDYVRLKNESIKLNALINSRSYRYSQKLIIPFKRIVSFIK